MEAELRGLSDEVAGTVRVATVYSVGLHALPPRLKPFLAAHPRVNVHLEYRQTSDIYQEVAAGTIDVGIVACPSPRRDIEVLPFAEEDMALVCAPEHPLARQAVGVPARPGRIALHRLCGRHPDAQAGGRPPARRRRPRPPGHDFDNIETIKNLVEIGSGVSILPADTVRQEVGSGVLAAVPFTPADSFRRPTGLLVKKTADPPGGGAGVRGGDAGRTRRGRGPVRAPAKAGNRGSVPVKFAKTVIQCYNKASATESSTDMATQILEKPAPSYVADAQGRFGGEFGGRFVPETIIPALDELTEEYEKARADPGVSDRTGLLRQELCRTAHAPVLRGEDDPGTRRGEDLPQA